MAARSQPPSPETADLAACQALLRTHARSFHAASLLLPGAVRAPASVLYAFCRIADDAVDAPDRRDAGVEAVEALRDRLARAYAGTPRDHPVDRALARVVARHAIPRLLPERLLEGLEWDAVGRHHETLADVFDYASRVAGSVGAMMAVLMGVRSERGLARACDLGVAMQLSNIARDVAEDAAMGRLYLPQAWLHEAGIDPATWLRRPAWSPALGAVVLRLLAEAERLYARAAGGIADLPLACRPGINAARLLYAEIGHEVARRGPAAWTVRAQVPAATRARLLARAVVTPWPYAPERRAPPLRANEALVHAAAAAPDDASAVAFVVDLFTRLQRRDLGTRAAQRTMR